MTRPAAKEKTLWPALMAAVALLLTAPQVFASRTASTRPELLPSPALDPAPATAQALAPAYVPQGFELQASTDPHPASFALFPEPAPAPKRLEPEKLASALSSWELTPNLQRIQHVVAESWQVRENLGPVDSPNLYQAFGLDPQNNTDPLGLSSPALECWACRVQTGKQPLSEGPKGFPTAEGLERTAGLVAAAARGPVNSSAKLNRQVAEAVLNPFEYVANKAAETVSGLWDLLKTPVTPLAKDLWQRFSQATPEQRVEAVSEAATDMAFAWATYQTGKALVGMVSLPSEPGMGPGYGSLSKLEPFADGGSWLLTEEQYQAFVEGRPLIGRPDGQFIIPSHEMDRLITETGGDVASLERALGTSGWQGHSLIRIDVPDPLAANPRLPTSDLSGANSLFVPGGETAGGIPEIAIDPVPASKIIKRPL